MKKTLLILSSALLLLTFSCKKNTEGNKSVIKTEASDSLTLPSDSLQGVAEKTGNEATPAEYTERYVGDDGSSALVTFNNGGEEKTISIRSNNKTISAPQKEAWEKGGVYGNFDIEIVAKNDTVTITQGDHIITLKKARGQ